MSPPRILIFGQDATLLATRRLVLEHSGMDVTVALDLQVFSGLVVAGSFELFLLCHSLSPDNRASALELTHSLHPNTRNLILGTTVLSPCAGPEDSILSAFADPVTLIDAVTQSSAHHTSNV